ncbi:DUF4916 domain-containing protein [uncultured Gulosibacter sp.]|uniref:DUF4916 domain-containing protein n=1 Tax=uncultured Gulosibacter sp. TaxID=1339167 RepID=UPI00288A9EE3|nr:DUF4916 domain-containing protein [uncultured Gulosibacter sp.]
MDVRTPDPEGQGGWMDADELDYIRKRVPIVYVEAIPVRVGSSGQVEHLGLLLRATGDGMIARSFVSGRVHYGETLREALVRHLEKDLGTMAFPQLPPALVPFTIAEFSPMPMTQLHDERQHAIALVYIVPVTGECQPRQDALEVTWVTPDDASDPDLLEELEGGRGALLRAAISYLQHW